MWAQREEMTVGRQLSNHPPSVVATLKQVELFVWKQGMLEGIERQLLSFREMKREYASIRLNV